MSRKKVLVCPLNWGLGHATRCIPIIHALLNESAEVLIAADGAPQALLKGEFPQLKFITLGGYNIRYSERMSMVFSMMLQSPKILFNIFLEHKRLKQIIRDYKIDCVISDNRYGLWNKGIHTVFITHQLFIKCPSTLRFLESVLRRINYFFIKRFNECWIPDSAGEDNLSGELSHGRILPGNAIYIGWLSRFNTSTENESQKRQAVLGIISGPEPHRSLWYDQLLVLLKSTNLSALIVTGEPQKQFDEMINGRIRLVSHLNAEAMKQAIMQSDVIVCRAGYSGIMDLVALKKKAVLIPTPGQTEQEYLAAYLNERKLFYTISQKEFKIERALTEMNGFGAFSKTSLENKYAEAVKRLLEKIS